MTIVPEIRIRTVNAMPVRGDGDFILYWMTAFRRTQSNFSLQRAVEWAVDLRKPLVVFEALRCGYQWASDRIHGFVIQGMADNAQRLASTDACYYPYLESAHGDAKGLLKSLADRSCVVVGDDFPSFFLPRMMAAAADQVQVRFELVDSNGILPMRAAEKVFLRAHDFRRFLQKNIRPHFDQFPESDPLENVQLPKLDSLPKAILSRWPAANPMEFVEDLQGLKRFPIDHNVAACPHTIGGEKAAQERLDIFVKSRLSIYDEERNQPERSATSRLSPYLHFGHISVHEVFKRVVERDGWTPEQIAPKATGSSSGWWGASAEVESFLDELITWREVGYNMSWQRDDHDQYESLPEWARTTLAIHASDPRPHLYTLEQFEAADTHNALWNAAQRQLTREGTIHNYLRMVWGKKILEWSARPQEALNVMIELNNKYAYDGRNPNSYSGIFWCFGRYDRAWGPERPIFGKVRYMSTDNTARKVQIKGYLAKYAE